MTAIGSLIIGIILAAATSFVGPLADALVYDRAAVAAGEWWRIATASLVHFSVWHLLANCLGLSLVALYLGREHRAWVWILLGTSAIASAIGVHLFEPQNVRYGGLSGLITACVVFAGLDGLRAGGARRAFCVLMLATLAVKLALDALAPRAVPGAAETVTVSAAGHIAAAICALVLFTCWVPVGRSSSPARLSRTSVRSASDESRASSRS